MQPHALKELITQIMYSQVLGDYMNHEEHDFLLLRVYP